MDAMSAPSIRERDSRMPSAAMLNGTIFLVDCDAHTWDMTVNSIACLADVFGARAALAATRVFCLEDTCCNRSRAAGFQVIADATPTYVGAGFDEERVKMGRKAVWLEKVMLSRELHVLQLLDAGVNVLRTDHLRATTCLRAWDLGDRLSLPALAISATPIESTIRRLRSSSSASSRPPSPLPKT